MNRNGTLLQRMEQMTDATPRERDLSKYFEENYANIPFSNLAKISAASGASMPTITRFIRRLGYSGFSQFLAAVRDEISRDNAPDAPCYELHTGMDKDKALETLFRQQAAIGAEDVQRTGQQLDIGQYIQIVQLLADETRPLYLLGTSTSTALISYFYYYAQYQRGNIHVLDGDMTTLYHRAVDADTRSVLLVVAIERISVVNYRVLEYFAGMNSETILITNRRNNALQHYARHTLFAHTGKAPLFKSRTAPLMVLEALFNGIAFLRGNAVQPRYDKIKELTEKLGVFTPQ